MGYGAFSLWAIVLPERFGLAPLPAGEMIKAADRASRELRKMFHAQPLKPWQARCGRGVEARFSGKRARTMPTGPEFF